MKIAQPGFIVIDPDGHIVDGPFESIAAAESRARNLAWSRGNAGHPASYLIQRCKIVALSQPVLPTPVPTRDEGTTS
jgi:hypothetical protein